MPLSHKPLEAITEADLRALVEVAAPETRRLDFKRELPGNSDENKREFLSDVTAYANSLGGDLMYGISEDAGAAASIIPQQGDSDATMRRLSQLIETGVDQRLPGVQMGAVPLAAGGFVLIVRVPQSWSPPHRVRSTSRFWIRDATRKHEMDVTELRLLFAQAGNAAERVRQFRNDRLALLAAERGPFAMLGPALAVVHLVPLRLGDPGFSLDLSAAPAEALLPLVHYGHGSRFNLDGFATFHEQQGKTAAYTLLFRSGAVEAADSSLLEPEPVNFNSTETVRFVPAREFPQALVNAVGAYLQSLRNLGVDLPLVLMISLLNVKGYHLALDVSSLISARLTGGGGAPIDRELVQLPEVLIDDWSASVTQLLQVPLDALWNAAGWPHCALYDEGGLFAGR